MGFHSALYGEFLNAGQQFMTFPPLAEADTVGFTLIHQTFVAAASAKEAAKLQTASADKAMGLQSQIYPRVIQIFRELTGGGPLQVPSTVKELSNPDTREDIERSLARAPRASISQFAKFLNEGAHQNKTPSYGL
jgi:hypothetical protein